MHSSRFRKGLGLCLALLIFSATQAGPVPANKPAAYPDWWFERDVIPRLNPANLTPNYSTSGTYAPADDFAAVNIGQLKHMARKAYDESQSRLPSTVWTTPSGQALRTGIRAWYLDDALTQPKSTGADDFSALNQGQLKNIAKLFYDPLNVLGYTGQPLAPLKRYPWSSESTDDDAYALVNLGQLKYMFSYFSAGYFFDPYMADSDLDGMPDGWEVEHSLNPNDASDASLISGGITNLIRYQQSLAAGNDPSSANALGLMVYSP